MALNNELRNTSSSNQGNLVASGLKLPMIPLLHQRCKDDLSGHVRTLDS